MTARSRVPTRGWPLSALRLAGLALLLAVGGCGTTAGQPFQPTLNVPQPLSAEAEVVQTFRPARPVAGIDVQLATYGTDPDPAGVLRISLMDGLDGPVLASGSLAGEVLGDAQWAGVRFDPPVATDGSTALALTWTGGTPLAAWSNTLPPEVAGPECVGDPPRRLCNDPYPDGQLLLDGRPVQGDLAFRVVPAGGPAQALTSFSALVRGAGSALLRQPLFALAWLLLLGGAAGLAVAGFARAGDRARGGRGRPRQQQRERDEARP